jgi:hypothetical protein
MRTMKSILESAAFRLIAGLAAIALIAFADRELNNAIPLALLYLLPVADRAQFCAAGRSFCWGCCACSLRNIQTRIHGRSPRAFRAMQPTFWRTR